MRGSAPCEVITAQRVHIHYRARHYGDLGPIPSPTAHRHARSQRPEITRSVQRSQPKNFKAHRTKHLVVPPPFHLLAHLKNDLPAVLDIIVLDERVVNPFPVHSQRPDVGFSLRTGLDDGESPLWAIASPK